MRETLRDAVAEVMATVRRPARSAAALETVAVLVAAVALVLGFLISLILFWGHELAISGPGSIGAYAAIGGAAVSAIAFTLGRVAVRAPRRGAQEAEQTPSADATPADAASAEATPADAARDGFTGPADRLRWYDLIAIGAAYAFVAMLGWFGVSQLLELSFIGAPVFAFPGAVLVGVAFALTAYVAFLGAAALRPASLSVALGIFLVVGAFTAMLESSDPDWWRNNLSALGMSSNTAAPAFNVTVIISGILVTTIARYATAGLPISTPHARRQRRRVRWAMVLIGILLGAVGLFPVDQFFLVHNTVATGMAVTFAVLVCALPWMLPTLPRVFLGLGYVFVAVIVLLGVFFATGYYNLTAVELIAAILVFTWIIVFLRTAGAASETENLT